MSQISQLKSIAYFEAVARHGRITKAADELGVSSSAISQQISILEQQLGTMLFRRVKRRLVLTEEGEIFFQSTSQALGLMRQAQERITHKKASSNLTVRISPTFGVRWISDRLPNYISQNPETNLHIDATSELTNFDKENVDIEIKYATIPQEGLYQFPLITDRVLPLCTPEKFEQLKCKSAEEILQSERLIHTVKSAVQWQDWCQSSNVSYNPTTTSLKFDRSSMSLSAAHNNLGIVLESATLAYNELLQGSLVPVFPKLGTVSLDAYWLFCPHRYLNRKAVRKFSEWVKLEAETHTDQRNELLERLGIHKDVQLTHLNTSVFERIKSN